MWFGFQPSLFSVAPAFRRASARTHSVGLKADATNALQAMFINDPSSCVFLNNSLLIRVVLAALDGELFSVGQHDLAETHGGRTVFRAIPHDRDLVAGLK